ncbi:lipoprotein N-acyltransferase Lnb domain-containing protein [Flavobacterium sp.]|uniref:lipoprotein N-acyltransferase Lnb domain-containing protein n=2 Tax=Flavobacterium sp. TaxID=239 RepID=UPI004047676C
MMCKNLLFALLILISFNGFAQNISLSEKAKVSILTCGLGPESYAMYGHTGIRIQDSLNNLDVVYNYGAFDFSTPNFIGRFIKGDLQYFVTYGSFIDFYYNYQVENREIIEQELNLTPLQINSLYQQLNYAVYSDERFYTYKFIDRNCTTMVVDKINKIIGQEYIKSDQTNLSYREILYPYMSDFYMKLGIQLIFGAKVDEPATRLFLPYEFKNALSKTQVNGNKIEKSDSKILQVTQSEIPFNWLNSIYSLLLVLITLVLLNKKWIKISYFIFAGVLGLFFSLVGLYSLHEEILWNYNILLFNPLLLIFAWYYKKKNFQKTLFLGKISLAMLLVYLAYMTTKIHLQIVWPFIVLHFYWIGKIVLQIKKSKLARG